MMKMITAEHFAKALIVLAVSEMKNLSATDCDSAFQPGHQEKVGLGPVFPFDRPEAKSLVGGDYSCKGKEKVLKSEK
jgi:hypothetical protein